MVQMFQFDKTEFPEVRSITPFCANDDRGGMVKDYAAELFAENGISFIPVETLYIESRRGVLRGLHFQREKPQAKLIRCLTGKVWAVVVDIRGESCSFGRWISEELSGENKRELFVPEGFAFGTLALEDSLISCKCGEKFYAECDGGIRWNDPDINVRWPLDKGAQRPIVSEKDRTLPFLKECMEGMK